MTPNMEVWLEQLNQVSQPRTYTIRQEGDQFYLVMPSGGEYPPTTALETVERLARMARAAAGRDA